MQNNKVTAAQKGANGNLGTKDGTGTRLVGVGRNQWSWFCGGKCAKSEQGEVGELTHGSLFAGIGGFDLGFERAGIKTIWQVELNPFCRRVLARHFPGAKRYADIRDCGVQNLIPVDIVTGGFPCQNISEAGNREGIEGEQSGLWKEMLRIICELRPQLIIVENVAALLWRGIGTVLADLSINGFDAEWRTLRAHDFWHDHQRVRVFIAAYPTGERRQAYEIFTRELQPCTNQTQREGLPSWVLSRRDAGRVWAFPDTGTLRIHDGLPYWMERMHGCGNAVVPDKAEWIGRRIVEAHN